MVGVVFCLFDNDVEDMLRIFNRVVCNTLLNLSNSVEFLPSFFHFISFFLIQDTQNEMQRNIVFIATYLFIVI